MAKEAKPVTSLAPIDWSKSASSGFEHVSSDDLGTPFLVVLQKGSAEVDPAHPDHAASRIEGAVAGCIINTIARSIIYKPGGTPVKLVPCTYQRLFVEWRPRNSGGGIVKSHNTADVLLDCTRNDKNQDILKNGNLIVTTGYFFCLMDNQGEWERVVLGMSSTQLKKARGWLNLATSLKVQGPDNRKITPPLFSHAYEVSTTPESNERGSWYGWKIEKPSLIEDPNIIALADEVNAASSVRRVLPSSTEEAQ